MNRDSAKSILLALGLAAVFLVGVLGTLEVLGDDDDDDGALGPSGTPAANLTPDQLLAEATRLQDEIIARDQEIATLQIPEGQAASEDVVLSLTRLNDERSQLATQFCDVVTRYNEQAAEAFPTQVNVQC
ncbi:MAG: hypothetical protein GEU28_05915 [Dehalococcoidia bacterium]|nr:hypothetical protein [Dehalococcoidia bacterium]